MQTSFLLWLWALRMSSAFIFKTEMRCKSKFWDNSRAECSNMNLSTLKPDRYPLNIETLVYLDLDNNGLFALDADVFHRVTKLRTLILRNNMLQILPHSLFSDLQELEFLDLSHNNLVSLTDERLFKTQNSLTNLDLSHNNLITIHQQVLRPLHYMMRLNLAQNPIVCDCELRSTMLWCEFGDLETQATCGSPRLYYGFSWTVLRPTDSCKVLQLPNSPNTTNSEKTQEMKENKLESAMLIAGLTVALILIWFSVVGLYVCNKLSNRCPHGREDSTYDDATPDENYYYEYVQSPTEERKKAVFLKLFTDCKSSVMTSPNRV